MCTYDTFDLSVLQGQSADTCKIKDSAFINKTYFSNVHLYLKAEKTPLNHIISDQLIIELLISILGEIEGVLMIVNQYVKKNVMLVQVVVVSATAYIFLGMFY